MEEGNIANREEAEKCRDLAKEFMRKGEYAKAARFFDKSLKLHQLPGVAALKAKAEQMASGGPSTPTAPSSGSFKGESQSTKSTGGSERPYTEEQESASKKILIHAKKSHYEVLGISKDANGDIIKKSYRKLALKFHPDKNSAPSAEGAFKAISTAFDTLSDPSKRDLYDQVGHDADLNNAQAQQGFPGAFRGFQHGGDMHGVSPEDLFSFLFAQAGPGMRQRGGFRTHTFHFGGGAHQHAQQQQQQQRQQQGGLGQLFQSLPMLLMIAFFILSSFSGSQQPLYSFRPTSSYSHKMATSSRGVSEGIPYFIPESNYAQYKSKSEVLRKLEREVEIDYRHILSDRCREERSFKNSKLYQAKFLGAEAKRKAETIQTPNCDEFHTRFVDKFSS